MVTPIPVQDTSCFQSSLSTDLSLAILMGISSGHTPVAKIHRRFMDKSIYTERQGHVKDASICCVRMISVMYMHSSLVMCVFMTALKLSGGGMCRSFHE
jgi:hypothetical protein